MTTLAIAQKLNAQMNLEFGASHLYVSLSNWCMERNYLRMAQFLRAQAQKCITHVMQVFDYMKKSGVFPVIKAVNLTDHRINSIEDLLKSAQENQKLRAHELERLAAEARINTDSPTLLLLENLYSEQQQNNAELNKHLLSTSTGDVSLTH